jgi:Protein of unknown function (DUF2961)/FG-GAP-like repeat
MAMKLVNLSLALALVACTEPETYEVDNGAVSQTKGPIGWQTYRRLDELPYLGRGISARQFSAFDRDNGNEDGFAGVYSCLSTGPEGCLLAEHRGSGELTSLWFTQINPTPGDNIPDEGDVRPIGNIRIELDGAMVVDANLQDVVDGKLGAPFVYPMVANGRQASGGVYLKVPMPYRRHMRVTVENNPRFYHVGYRQFADAEGVTRFDPADHANDVVEQVRAAGTRDPKPARPGATKIEKTVALASGQTLPVAELTGPGAISELRVALPGVASPAVLAGLRVQISFDGKSTVDAPLGELVGAGLGASNVRALLFAASTTANSWYTSWWPMPYRETARVELVNTTASALTGVRVQVTSAPDPQWTDALGPTGDAGYFSTVSRAGNTVRGEDWNFADVTGRGKLVGVSHTMIGAAAGNPRGYLEGDERGYVDGVLAPHWHGTGTEDFYEAGWYFARGLFSAPFVGNTKHEVEKPSCPFECDSAYRVMLADALSYGTSLRFGIEHGPNNDSAARYGSTAFLYTRPDTVMRRTDAIDVTSDASRQAHAYGDTAASTYDLTARYEGETSKYPIPGRVRATAKTISFRVALAPGNTGVLLRRTSDQQLGFQSAAIEVDHVPVGTWRQPRANLFARWLADEFALPASSTAGKSQITVTIEPDVGSPPWTASRYTVDNVVGAWVDTTPPIAPGELKIVNGRRHAIWLAWTEPTDDTSIARYRVYAAPGTNVPIDDAHLVGTTRTIGFAHGPLPANTTRSYRIVAVDAAGNASAPSGVITATTRPRRGGIDGDGRTDLVSFTRGTAADVFVALSTGTAFGPAQFRQDFFALGSEVPMLGDFNGDGKDDLVTFTRGSLADVYVALSTGTGFGPGVLWHEFFALGDERPAVGDVNGDGMDDIITFTRGNGGKVYVALSTGAGFGPGLKWNDTFAFGNETPAIGDVDGDGRDDIVTFTHGANADVFVGLSDGSRFVGGDYGVPQKWHDFFALTGEVPGLGDFDGDGRDDLVTFTRGTAGSVYIARSTGQAFGAGIAVLQSFATGDQVPGVGDFDGDGLDDLVAFTRGAAADVFVSRATATGFGAPVRWHDAFATGTEWPQPSLLRP